MTPRTPEQRWEDGGGDEEVRAALANKPADYWIMGVGLVIAVVLLWITR